MKTIQQIGAQTKAAKGDLQGLSKLQKKQLIEKIQKGMNTLFVVINYLVYIRICFAL